MSVIGDKKNIIYMYGAQFVLIMVILIIIMNNLYSAQCNYLSIALNKNNTVAIVNSSIYVD